MLEDLFGGPVNWIALVTALAVAVGVAYVLSEVAARLARAALLGIGGRDADVGFHTPIVRRPIRITRAAVFIAALAALVPPASELAGASLPVGLDATVLAGWLFGSGLRVTLIALVTYLLVRVVASVARRLEDEISHDTAAVDASERIKRARTLSRLVQNALTVFVIAVALLMVLRELDVDVMPVLTGAGIVGLAVGFGAQTLVKDLISGFFVILENQVRVGDVATINGTGGLVEAINLRTIVLRDLEGVVHVFPNGSIETLSNRTKDFSYYVVDVGVAYKEDTDDVVAVLRQVGTELAADPAYKASVLEPLDVLGVDAFGDSQVTIKIRIKTVPLKQWEVGRELRRRIKKAFDAKGIEIPFPHLSVYFGEASRPFALRQAS
ncbi:MAG: mechanosensitive ion channel family protein [Acidobacteria bacterium]|nr:mechanosensitive ion channel family protein [Acidobacteriota bacterium]